MRGCYIDENNVVFDGKTKEQLGVFGGNIYLNPDDNLLYYAGLEQPLGFLTDNKDNVMSDTINKPKTSVKTKPGVDSRAGFGQILVVGLVLGGLALLVLVMYLSFFG